MVDFKPIEKQKYAAPALTKGLDILELMAEEVSGLTLKQIANKLGRSKSEIFRMLVVLNERGYINMDSDSDVYTITLKLFEIAHKQSNIERLSSAASPIMAKLSRAIKQSCHLVIVYNGRGIVVAQHDSPEDRHFRVRLGASVELPNTCSGHVILAFSDHEHCKEILDQAGKKVQKLCTDRKFIQRINVVKKQGYECIQSKQIQGIKDIAYPVYDYANKLIATLVVPFLEHLDYSHPISFSEVQKKLEIAAMDVSKRLGYSI